MTRTHLLIWDYHWAIFFCPTVSISGAQRAAKTGLGVAIVPRVNAEAANARASLLAVNVTQMFVGIVGSGNNFLATR